MTLRYPFPSFVVNICEACWGNASWGNQEEYLALLEAQRYIADYSLVWLHRAQMTSEARTAMVCGEVINSPRLPLSLIELPASAQDHRQGDPVEAALETALATLDAAILALNSTLREGLEAITLAIRDLDRHP